MYYLINYLNAFSPFVKLVPIGFGKLCYVVSGIYGNFKKLSNKFINAVLQTSMVNKLDIHVGQQ